MKVILLFLFFIGTCFGQKAVQKKKPTQKKAFEIKGSLQANIQLYGANGIASRRTPFTWYLSGSPTVRLLGYSMPFNFSISEQHRSYSQPFNRYGVSPSYKWIKLHAGYRNIRFSDFTLGGANFLGGGFELNPGKLRLGAVYGRFNKAINEDLGGANTPYKYLRPSFLRNGLGVKIGFGSNSNFMDFSFFRAQDMPYSIAKPTLRSGVNPMENHVLGIKSRLKLTKKLGFDFEVAGSVLTRNLYLKDLNFTDPRLNSALKYVAINETTGLYKAIKGGLNQNFKFGNLRIDYQRIDPNYQSLGSYYFQTDVEQISISQNVNHKKWQVGGSLGKTRNNLNKTQKQTSIRTVGALSLGYKPLKNLSITSSYSNFGVSQGRGISDFFNDSLAVSIINSNLSAGMNLQFGTAKRKQNASLNFNLQNTNDQNIFTQQFANASSQMMSALYNINISKLMINSSFSFSNIKTYNLKIKSFAPNFGGTYSLKNYRFSINHSNQFRLSDGLSDGFLSNSNFAINRQLKKQSIGLNGSYLFNKHLSRVNNTNLRNFSEYRSTISYGLRF